MPPTSTRLESGERADHRSIGRDRRRSSSICVDLCAIFVVIRDLFDTISAMAKPAEVEKLTGLASRFGAFVAERHPFALADALEAFEAVDGAAREPRGEEAIDALRPALPRELERRLRARRAADGAARHDAATSASTRASAQAHAEVLDACDGFLRRAAIEASLTPRRAPRDPARHGADARDRQSPEGVLHRRRGPVRQRRVPGQGLPLARAGSDLRRGDPAAARRRVSSRRRPLDGRRDRAGDSRSRRHARDASRARHRADGAERADGQGRPAARRQGSAHRRLRLGHPAAGRAARRPRR